MSFQKMEEGTLLNSFWGQYQTDTKTWDAFNKKSKLETGVCTGTDAHASWDRKRSGPTPVMQETLCYGQMEYIPERKPAYVQNQPVPLATLTEQRGKTMMTSADAEKRIWHQFMIKTLRKLGITVNFLNATEGICENLQPMS